tara:strand:- start:26 stop:145 length:120 start_codon:yes stop_codon:yes gene_type:complete
MAALRPIRTGLKIDLSVNALRSHTSLFEETLGQWREKTV